MQEMHFERILEDLPRMTPAQRKQLTLRCGILGTSESDVATSSGEAYFAQAVYTAMMRKGFTPMSPAPPRKGTKISATFKQAAAAVKGLLTGRQLNDTQTFCVTRRIVSLVILGMIERKIPISYTAVLQQTAKGVEYLDRAFPGYASIGLMKMIDGKEGAAT